MLKVHLLCHSKRHLKLLAQEMNRFLSVIEQRDTSSKLSWKMKSLNNLITLYAGILHSGQGTLFIQQKHTFEFVYSLSLILYSLFSLAIMMQMLCFEVENNQTIFFQIAFPYGKQHDILNDESIITNPCLSSGYTQHAPHQEESSGKHGYTLLF